MASASSVHHPTVQLVCVDGVFVSRLPSAIKTSSSVKDTPRLSAKARIARTKGSFCGKPRAAHMDTVLDDLTLDRPRDTVVGPPSSLIISRAVRRMDKGYRTFCDITQAQNVGTDKCVTKSDNLCMGNDADASSNGRAQTVNGDIVDRLEAVRVELDMNKTDFAALMGFGYAAYKNALDRRRIRLTHVLTLARKLNLSMDYLCALIDEPYALRDDSPYWVKRARSK